MDTKLTKNQQGNWICPFCNKPFRALLTHTRQAHDCDGDKFRIQFGFPKNFTFENDALRLHRREMSLKQGMDVKLAELGRTHRFVKGQKMSSKIVDGIRTGHLYYWRMRKEKEAEK